MARGRRNVQRRGGRVNRDTRLPIHDELDGQNHEDDQHQSPQTNQQSNHSPPSVNEHGQNHETDNSQVHATPTSINVSTQAQSQGTENSLMSTRKRSAYLGQALEKENNKQKGKMVIQFTVDGGRPMTADQSAKFASEMGKACRDLLPLRIDDWRKIPMSEKQCAWERVKNRLNIDDITKTADKFKAADKWMGSLYRNHRSKTKRSWMDIGDAAKPSSLNEDNWKKLTEYWTQEIEEERAILQSNEPSSKRTKSMIGRDARSNVKYLHRAGSRSFQSRINEQINQNRQPPNAIEFFKQTRYRDPLSDGTGGWVSQQAKEDYEQMVKMYEDSQSSDNPQTPEEIVDKFMKASARSDYYPGRGYGLPAVGSSSRRRVQIEELKVALHETQAKLQEERNIRKQQGQLLTELTRMVRELCSSYPSSSGYANGQVQSLTPSNNDDGIIEEDDD